LVDLLVFIDLACSGFVEEILGLVNLCRPTPQHKIITRDTTTILHKTHSAH